MLITKHQYITETILFSNIHLLLMPQLSVVKQKPDKLFVLSGPYVRFDMIVFSAPQAREARTKPLPPGTALPSTAP